MKGSDRFAGDVEGRGTWHHRGPARVWLTGDPAGGPEALAERLIAGDVATAGAWAAVVLRPGLPPEAIVAPFGGCPLLTDGSRVGWDLDAFEPVARPVDPDGVRQHLDADSGDPGATFLVGVRRIPPGHAQTLDGRSPARRVWSPEPASVGEPVGAVRRAIDDACARWAADPTWVALSGGLDSSVLAVALGRMTSLRPVSNRFPGLAADEGAYQRAVCARVGCRSVDVASGALDPVDVLELLGPGASPPWIANHHLNLALLRAAGGPLLTGFGGDELFGYGLNAPRELLAAGRPLRALWEAGWIAHRFWRPLDGASPLRAVRRVHGALARPRRDPVALAREEMLDPLIGRSRDEIGRVASAAGAVIRTPLLDPELASVMLGVPTEARVRRGRTRWVVREAYADLLPPEVRRRDDKANLTRSFDGPFFAGLDRWWPVITSGVLDRWRSRASLDASRRAGERGDPHASAELWRALGAARWLTWHTRARQGP